MGNAMGRDFRVRTDKQTTDCIARFGPPPQKPGPGVRECLNSLPSFHPDT